MGGKQFKGVDVRKVQQGELKYRGICSMGERAVCAPQHGQKLLIYEASGQVRGVDLNGVGGRFDRKFYGICVVGGKIVAAPYDSDELLVFDPMKETVKGVKVGRVAYGKGKFRGICAVGKKAFAAPCHSDELLIYDSTTDEVRGVDITSIARGGWKYADICVVDGKVVASPCHADKVLIYDPVLDEVRGVDLPAPPPRAGSLTNDIRCKYRGICAVDERAILAPVDTDHLLIFNTATDEFSFQDVTSVAKGYNKFHGICTIGNRVVAVPGDGNNLLIYEPATKKISGLDISSIAKGDKKFGAACAVGGKVVAAPLNSDQLLVFEVDRAAPAPLNLMCSNIPEHGRLVDLAAATVSYWVYDAKAQDPVPDLPYVNLVSNCLMEETKTGSVKVGAVTGSFETGRKVLFLAFKGTSYLMDFINWNIEHDHAETNDHDFFIHAGAGRVIRNLYFLKKDAFISLLESAYENGVRELVFTGHSLGGMYATSAIAKAFKEFNSFSGKNEKVEKLLRTVRCVTYGAPMCFGHEDWEARDPCLDTLAHFISSRAVNYIHDNDPCPRAWSGFDVKEFIPIAGEALKSGVNEQAGGVAGAVVSRIVDEALARFLALPDFDQHLLPMSKNYFHLPKVRVLKAASEPCPETYHWRDDFVMTAEGLHHHAINLYLERLLDHSDPARQECVMYGGDGKQMK